MPELSCREARFHNLADLQRYIFADFRRFLIYSFNYLERDIADHHLAFADAVTCGERRVCVLQPRGAGKTSEGILYCLFRASRRPNMRIRILGANAPHSEKIAYELYDTASTLPVTQFLVPKRRTMKRINWRPANIIVKDHCVEFAGIDSTTNTGSHADLVWADDIEARDSRGSPTEHEKLLNDFAKIIPIVNPPNIRYPGKKSNQDIVEILVTGTPWERQSVYKVPEDKNKPHVLRGAKFCVCPALVNGKSFWEKLISTQELMYRQSVLPPSQFALHYEMNMDYIDTRSALIKMETVRVLSKQKYPFWPNPALTPSQREPVIHNVQAFIDPSYGGDEWAISFAGVNGGLIHLLDVHGWHLPTEQALTQALPILKKHQVSTIWLESNLPGTDGIEKVISNALRQQGLYCEVKRKHVVGDKDDRLSTWLVTSLNTGQVVVHPRILEPGPTLDQMSQFSDLGTKAMINDDRLDCMALACICLGEDLYTNNKNDPPASF